MKTSTRVRGVTYSSPDEARVAADEIEHHANRVADELRRNGNDTQAEQVFDRGRADAEKLRAFARQLEETEAKQTPQPAGRPKSNRRRKVSRPSKGDRPSSWRDARVKMRAPRAAPALRRGYRRSGAQAAVGGWSQIGWQIVALTIGAALVTLILTPNGVAAFRALTGSVAGGLSVLLDPVDPLAPRYPTGAISNLIASAATVSQTPPANRRPVRRTAGMVR